MAGKRKATPKKMKDVEEFVSPQGIKWDGIKITVEKGIQYAAVTVNGFAFGVTNEVNLTIYADSSSDFSASEVIGTTKKYGNVSDYEFSYPIAPIIDSDLNVVPIEDIRASIEAVPQRFTSIGGVAQQKINSMNWKDTADKLIPFVQAVQSMYNGIEDVKMV